MFNTLCNGGTPTANLSLGQLHASMQPTGTTLECANAQLVEVKFSELDAASKDPVKATFVFVPAQVRYVTTSGGAAAASGGNQRKVATSFALTLPNVAGNRVSRISEIRISRGTGTDTAGVFRVEGASSPVQFANLKISLASNDTTWAAWRDDFLVNGNHLEANEKAGTLALLDAAMQPVYTLQLLNVGLAHFTSKPAKGMGRFEAEIYVEQIKPAVAAASTGAAAGSTPAPTTPTEKKSR